MAAGDNILGAWKITDTEAWGSEELALLGPPIIRFGKRGFGRFSFLAIEADVDYIITERAGEVRVDFTWVGTDDGDPVSGRGSAWTEGVELRGEIFIHRGDRSTFTAVR